jgi:ligand-binding SRPBCC domain-containing protein
VRVHRLEREQVVPRPLDESFEFFSRASNLERITPPWLNFAMLTPEPIEMRAGAVIQYRLRLHRIPIRWISQIEEFVESRRFVDRQLRGPYRLWHHRHEFASVLGGTRVRDHVDYALPLGPLGELAHAAVVRRDLARIFDYRYAAVARMLG